MATTIDLNFYEIDIIIDAMTHTYENAIKELTGKVGNDVHAAMLINNLATYLQSQQVLEAMAMRQISGLNSSVPITFEEEEKMAIECSLRVCTFFSHGLDEPLKNRKKRYKKAADMLMDKFGVEINDSVRGL